MSIDPWNLYYPRFFSRMEFGEWAADMDIALLVLLDAFRARWGQPVYISKAPGAIGRRAGTNSQHDLTTWGTVRAVDVHPSGILVADDLRKAQRLAIETGFTGVGVYPHWKPRPGLHVDVRRGHNPGQPALWGGIRRTPESQQEYVSADEAISFFTEVPA